MKKGQDTKDMKEQIKRERQRRAADRAVTEALQLYHAWLGYLLRRLGEQEVRVPVHALTEALGRLTCTVRREDGDYVIAFAEAGEAVPSDRPKTDRD